MASIKLHIFKGKNNGAASCDFRGENAIGHATGDEHRTIAEIDPAPDSLIAKVLALGPEVNEILDQMVPAESVSSFIGGDEVGFRFGVWDN